MSQAESKELFRRSDGFWEDGEGNFAVVLLKSDGPVDADGMMFFTYRVSFTTPAIRVQWNKADKYALFPFEVANGLINLRYARHITESEAAQSPAQAQPATAVATPAPAPQPEQAPAPASGNGQPAPAPAPQEPPAPAPQEPAPKATEAKDPPKAPKP